MIDYQHEQTIAVQAARDAARLTLAVRDAMLDNSGTDTMEKDGREPVTVADYGAQAVILRRIALAFPDDASRAEEAAAEFAALGDDAQRNAVLHHVGEIVESSVTQADVEQWLDHGHDVLASRSWVIDPIDGTKGFIRGDQYAIAIALVVDGEPEVAALACPLLPVDTTKPDGPSGVVLSAIRGQGAWLEPLTGGERQAVTISPTTNAFVARVVESFVTSHTDHNFSETVMGTAGIGGDPVRMDSQAKYAAVADGRAEIYIRYSRSPEYKEKVWDHAAGVLIVQEAGGRVTDMFGDPLDFSLGERLANNTGILATNGVFHDALLDAIRAAQQQT